MEQLHKESTHEKKGQGVRCGTSLQKMYESMRKGGAYSPTYGRDGEPYDDDSDPDDCYCE